MPAHIRISGWQDRAAALTVSMSQIDAVGQKVRDQTAHRTRIGFQTEFVGRGLKGSMSSRLARFLGTAQK